MNLFCKQNIEPLNDATLCHSVDKGSLLEIYSAEVNVLLEIGHSQPLCYFGEMSTGSGLAISKLLHSPF